MLDKQLNAGKSSKNSFEEVFRVSYESQKEKCKQKEHANSSLRKEFILSYYHHFPFLPSFSEPKWSLKVSKNGEEHILNISYKI